MRATPLRPPSITAALYKAANPQPLDDLRFLCRVRTSTLYERLAAMTADGRILRSAHGYHLPLAYRPPESRLSLRSVIKSRRFSSGTSGWGAQNPLASTSRFPAPL